jgi:16S rRNA (guanine527-N7)-methyltransferase
MNDEIEVLLADALIANGYDLSSVIQEKLRQYLFLLQRWNQVFNLTAIRNMPDMVWLHILDSLAISPYLQGKRIIDVGTGAGLPGIPLALTQPDKEFVLLDSNSKKTRFLMQAKLELDLNNVEVIHSRSEDYKPLQKFDSIVSRAFSSLAIMLAHTQHMITQDGQFLAMKGVYPRQELQALPNSFTVLGVHPLVIKGLAAERHVIRIQRK